MDILLCIIHCMLYIKYRVSYSLGWNESQAFPRRVGETTAGVYIGNHFEKGRLSHEQGGH